MRPPTLNIFPSLPMHQDQTSTLKHEENRQKLPRGLTSSSEQEGRLKIPDPKTLRRLAQNREAARKSRLRKKAYIQQLETSRIKLVQLEQELHRSRSTHMNMHQNIHSLLQGSSFSGGVVGGHPNLSMGLNLSSDAVVYDMEYGRWLEEHHKLTCELRAAFVEQLHENELSLYVNNWLAHFDQLIHLKSMVAKTDSFHLISGAWKSPAERCFLWIGGFRPSQIIKIILKQIEPLSDNQLMGIYGLQNSTQEGEEALSNGLESLSQSLSNTIASDSLTSPPNDMSNYMGQMAIAINKLSTLEGFVRQADNLRQQTIHRLLQVLTVRQTARCFLTISEYFHSLRALSSLWLARPRQE
uniref:BZIP transcription factor n=1 Tax=Kalanchoe fedtschenkoi TaxID=63787 RepID=A0A7N0V0C2_KALFE